MKTVQLDLGASQLASAPGSPFSMPAAQWQALDTFFGRVNAVDADASAVFTGVLPAFAALKSGAATWTAHTRPGLLTLARQMSDYGRHVAAVLAPALAAQSARWESASPAPGDGASVTALLAPMLAAASANAALAGTLAAQLQALSATLEQVNQGKAAALAGLMAPPGGAWNQGSGGLSARLAAEMAAMAQREAQLAALLSVVAVVPVASVEHLRGAWGGIAADLGAGQDALAAAIAEQEPFLLGCDLAMAALQWQQVADEAAAFAAQLN